jgi:hypothetical protein
MKNTLFNILGEFLPSRSKGEYLLLGTVFNKIWMDGFLDTLYI